MILSTRIAFGLLKIFERTKYNYQNRIRFANMARKRLHFNRYLELEYSRLNGYSEILDQMKHGIESLLDLIESVEDIRYETVSLASILNKGWDRIQSSGYLQYFLDLINEKLNQRPKLIASLAYRMAAYHGRFDAAKIIILSRIEQTRNKAEKEIFSNALAKIIAAPGGTQDFTDAISCLNNFDSNSSRNHVAKLLFLRGGGTGTGVLRSRFSGRTLSAILMTTTLLVNLLAYSCISGKIVEQKRFHCLRPILRRTSI